MLSSEGSMAAGMLVGSVSTSTIQVALGDGGKQIEIFITQGGNYGKGSQEEVTKTLNEFRMKYAEKMNECCFPKEQK